MLKGLVELGIKTAIDDDKLQRIINRRCKEYEAEINRLVVELDKILTPEEVKEEEKKIIRKCLDKYDSEVHGYWGRKVHPCWENPPKKSSKQYTFLERGKQKLYHKLTQQDGQLMKVVADNFLKVRSEFELWMKRLTRFRDQMIENVLPILPASLKSFQTYYIHLIEQDSSYQRLDYQLNGMISEKLRQAFESIEEWNEEQLRVLKGKMLGVLDRHKEEVSTFMLPQLGSAESYEAKVKREVMAEMVVNVAEKTPPAPAPSPFSSIPSVSSDPSSVSGSAVDLKPPAVALETEEDFASCFSPHEKNEECFEALDRHFGGELARQLNKFHEFLSHRFSELNKKRSLADPLPLEANLKTHVFLSHDWGEGGKNHWKVKRIGEALREKGLLVWIDDDRGDRGESGIVAELDSGLAHAIDDSHCFLAFLTQNYIRKVDSKNTQDFCLREFCFACQKLSSCRIIPIVMEAGLCDRNLWGNIIGFNLPSPLFHNFSPLFALHELEWDPHEFSLLIDQLFDRIVDVMREYPRNKALPEQPATGVLI